MQDDIDIVAAPRIAPVCRDPDDDKVIATAIYGAVDYLVTEDDDLRTPAMVAGLAAAGIQIISISSLIRQLA